MLTIFQAAVLGAVQGISEFVPISSSGHLVILPKVFGWSEPGLVFDVLLHVASLVALLVYFRSDLLDLIKGIFGGDRGSRKLAGLLVVGTIPAAVAGVLLGDYFDKAFKDAAASAIQLVITGFILIAAEMVYAAHLRRRDTGGVPLREMDDLGWGDAGLIGIAQAIAIIPGISRSGSTIGAGLALRVERETAARFAFLLAIPALVGATVVALPKMSESHISTGAGVAGFLVSLVVSYVAIATFIRYLKTNTLYPFAAYCIVAGAIFYLLVR
jgi:undecaprenyl-diphosphatase